MTDSYRALCSDFYINQRLNLKMDLPRARETVLDMFDRVRRQFPAMDQFRRYKDELALESNASGAAQQWVAIRTNNIRSGTVNPETLQEAYALHLHLLEVAPYFLSISPLDVDYLELLYGFDLLAAGNHDQIVYDALLAGTPLGAVLDIKNASIVDCQPVFGVALPGDLDAEAHVEVKTRPSSRGPKDADAPAEPISVYLTLRTYGPLEEVSDLPGAFRGLCAHGENLLESKVVRHLIMPIRDVIATGQG